MLSNHKLLKDNLYNIKLHGYSEIKKETIYENNKIIKYIFYLECHGIRYELTAFTLDGNENNPIYEIRLTEVDEYQIPNSFEDVKFYSYNSCKIHLSYNDFNSANKGFKHDEKNIIARKITHLKYNEFFLICEAFGIVIEKDDVIRSSSIYNLLDENSCYGTLYINPTDFIKMSKRSFSEFLGENIKQTDCYVSSNAVLEKEKLLQC